MKAIESFNLEDSFGLISLEEAEKINGGVRDITANAFGCVLKGNIPILAGAIAPIPDLRIDTIVQKPDFIRTDSLNASIDGVILNKVK